MRAHLPSRRGVHLVNSPAGQALNVLEQQSTAGTMSIPLPDIRSANERRKKGGTSPALEPCLYFVPTPSVPDATSEKAAARKCHRTAPSPVTARSDVFPKPGAGKPSAGRHRMTLTLRSPPPSEGTTYVSG
jgi:hypothetical protein